MLTKVFEGRKCIDVVYDHLKEACGDEYFLCVSTSMSPHLFGECAFRPRIIFRMLRRSLCLVGSAEAFEAKLHETDSAIAEVCSELAPRRSFSELLISRGYGPRESPPPARSNKTFNCPCLKPFHHRRPVCQHHHCSCNACKSCVDTSQPECKWAMRHAKFWRELETVSSRTYMSLSVERGLPADSLQRTPRQRNLTEIAFNQFEQNCPGSNVFESDAVYDRTQNCGYHMLRTDGLIPTIATGTELFAMRWGTLLSPAQLFVLMGFPFHLYNPTEVSEFTQEELRRFIGNTIHPAVFGVCAASLLSVMRGPSGTSLESQSTWGDTLEDSPERD